jgi:paraquat-inducible protein A
MSKVDSQSKNLAPAISYSLAALFLYIPANICPFMHMTLYGARTESTVWGGVVMLAQDGAWLIALIVLLVSIVIPFFKILALFILCVSIHFGKLQTHQSKLHSFIEVVGRWSMLDIFLLTILVALIKLKSWANVDPASGALAFTGVVIFTMLASASLTSELNGKEYNFER